VPSFPDEAGAPKLYESQLVSSTSRNRASQLITDPTHA